MTQFGSCRFGSNCAFLHSDDVPLATQNSEHPLGLDQPTSLLKVPVFDVRSLEGAAQHHVNQKHPKKVLNCALKAAPKHARLERQNDAAALPLTPRMLASPTRKRLYNVRGALEDNSEETQVHELLARGQEDDEGLPKLLNGAAHELLDRALPPTPPILPSIRASQTVLHNHDDREQSRKRARLCTT